MADYDVRLAWGVVCRTGLTDADFDPECSCANICWRAKVSGGKLSVRILKGSM
jgi:hypothetical protein